MKSGVRVAMALGTGYLLGRNHKMRLALALGAAAATGQLGRAPGQLAQRGTKALGGTPLGTLQEPGQRLVEAGKSAAVAAVVGRINSLSDRLAVGAEEATTHAQRGTGRGGDREGADENGADEDGADEDGADEDATGEDRAARNAADQDEADQDEAEENGSDQNGAGEKEASARRRATRRDSARDTDRGGRDSDESKSSRR